MFSCRLLTFLLLLLAVAPARAQIYEQEAVARTREAAAHEMAAMRWAGTAQVWEQARAAWMEEEDVQRHKLTAARAAAMAEVQIRGDSANVDTQIQIQMHMQPIMKARAQAQDRRESANENVQEARAQARAQWVEAAQMYVRAAQAHEAAARMHGVHALQALAQAWERAAAAQHEAAAQYEKASQARETAVVEYEAARAREWADSANVDVQMPETATQKYQEAVTGYRWAMWQTDVEYKPELADGTNVAAWAEEIKTLQAEQEEEETVFELGVLTKEEDVTEDITITEWIEVARSAQKVEQGAWKQAALSWAHAARVWAEVVALDSRPSLDRKDVPALSSPLKP